MVSFINADRAHSYAFGSKASEAGGSKADREFAFHTLRPTELDLPREWHHSLSGDSIVVTGHKAASGAGDLYSSEQCSHTVL